MKTAISIPDETFDQVSRRADALGMSRSEFFTRAAQRYLQDLDAQSVTRQIDEAVMSIGDGDDSGSAAVAAGRLVLDAGDDEW